MANGGDVIYHFKGDTTDLDKKTKSTSNTLNNLGKVGKGALAMIGTASVVAGTAIAGVMTKSVKEFSKLEQTMGGAKLLFGESADFIEQKSKKAFRTAGLSANDYLQQVNGLAVGLKTALGGNEQAAAELADKIITAEADIVAATGNTQENIQNAFNGIMKGNYTMLDNLQLGIKPTKEGMQEVIDKVNEWNATQGKATQYQMGNYADMQSALVDYVKMQKIAGYASREASETIQGSISSLTASWTNFLSGAGSIKDVIKSLITVGKNIGKVILDMLPDIVDGLIELVNSLIPAIPTIIQKLLPALLDGVVNLVNALITVLPKAIQQIANMLPTMIPKIIQAILKMIPALLKSLPLFIKAGMDLVFGLIQGLVSEESINSIVEALPEIIETMITSLMEAVPMLLLQAPRITIALATGMIKAIPTLVSKIPQIVNAIVNGIKNGIGRIGNVGGDLMRGLWNGIKGLKDWVVNKVKALGKSIIKGLKSVLGIHSPSTEFAMIGRFSVLGYTEALDKMKGQLQEQIQDTFAISPQLVGSSSLHYSPNIIVNNNVNMSQDPLGRMVGDIKTFANGAKNDYNYGMGV